MRAAVIFCAALSLSYSIAIAQTPDDLTVRIGVPWMQNKTGNNGNLNEVRNYLIEVLNRQKPNSKSGTIIKAIPLNATTLEDVVKEAEEKHCPLILYTNLDKVQQFVLQSGGSAYGAPMSTQQNSVTMTYLLWRTDNKQTVATAPVSLQSANSQSNIMNQEIGIIAKDVSRAVRK
jgi:hypothetical protein